MKWTVTIYGRLAGAIGQHGTHSATFNVEANDRNGAMSEAITHGYEKGLEHITVTRVKPEST